MPTVLRDGPYRFYFYATDEPEPPHVHVKRDASEAKFWLSPVQYEWSKGFPQHELREIESIVRTTTSSFWSYGMGSSKFEWGSVLAQTVTVTNDSLIVDLSDGRTISAPLVWYPRLLHGTPQERAHWEFNGGGTGIHWPELDEDISVEGLIFGRPSRESSKSFQRWLDQRKLQTAG